MEKSELALAKQHICDPVWRLNHLYFIIDKSGSKIRFQLNQAQKRLFDREGSTGSKTASGRKRQKESNVKHGFYSKESIEERRKLKAFLESTDELLKQFQ